MSETLNLVIGEKIQLQKVPPDRTERYLVTVIGYLLDQSLIITAPLNEFGKTLIIRPGMHFNVRMLHGNSIKGFITIVLQSYSHPYPHVHLSYPKEVESILVRNAQRICTIIRCNVRNTRSPDAKESYYPGQFIDLSKTGARIESKAPLGAKHEALSMQFSINVNEEDERLGIIGLIRSVTVKKVGDEDWFHTGVQFKSLNRYQQVLLHAYVLEKLRGGV